MTLLLDALNRCLQEPQCAQRWHSLMAIWLETRDQAARNSVLSALEAVPQGDARADILRLTFLAGASGESRFENAAAARVLESGLADTDRLAAFMSYLWLGALQNLETRSDFINALCAGLMPEMAQRLMQEAVLALPRGFPARRPGAIERVAVVVPYIGNRFHTPSMMAVAQAAVLARAGRQVHLFSAQELMPADMSLYRGDGRELTLPPLDAPAWSEILPPGVGMTISDSRFSLPGRWRNLMPVLTNFDPDVVLLVGLYSPLAAALCSVRPAVGISVNTVPPIAPVDVWLTADPTLPRQKLWQGIAAPQAVFHPWRIQRSTRQWPLTRAALGVDASAVIWVTAGFRLEHEIKGEWAGRMMQLLARQPHVVWLLVGGEGRLPPVLANAGAGRVRALATRDDLPGILRNCDIFVNPPRMGGGFSVAEAMAEGLPVTSFAGSDGGDKVGELALADLDSYMERLAALTASRSLRASIGESLRKRFAERFDLDASGPALVAACEEAGRQATARLTRPS
jgi:glycosyltransferase involved in cell wall biosynthesis